MLCLVVLWLGLMLRLSDSIEGQAPGDDDPLCTEEFVDGIQNPFFDFRPVYSARERPLMDSRDYNRLLQESGDAYIAWQSVDRDNNNTDDSITEVKRSLSH